MFLPRAFLFLMIYGIISWKVLAFRAGICKESCENGARNEGLRMTHDDMTRLLDAILLLKTKEELERFFDDLCTIQEINAMVQRFDVALQLDKGLTYSQIAGVTHASTATISRVNRSLVYGAEGYKLAIERMRQTEKGDE